MNEEPLRNMCPMVDDPRQLREETNGWAPDRTDTHFHAHKAHIKLLLPLCKQHDTSTDTTGRQPPAAGSPALPPPRPTLQYDYPGSVKVDLHSRRALRPLHRPRAHLRWDSLSRASLVPKQGDDAERGGGLEARSHSPPDQKMLMYWPMRLRWSCEMHSAIQTMLRISCSLIFTYA